MRKLVWLESAVDDLARLRKFIAKENPSAAKRAAQAIKESSKNMIEHPEIGKPVDDLPLYRDFVIRFGTGGYILRYRIVSDDIYVVHIRHHREMVF